MEKKKTFIQLFLLLLFMANAICKAGEVPMRLDLHLAGGAAYPWTYISEIFPFSVLIDFDVKALIRKSDIKHKIPRKYSKFVGDEIYVGHMLIPNTVAFSINQERHEWDAYIDWAPLGITLIRVPKSKPYSAPASFRFGASILGAYHILKRNTEDDDPVFLHSVRPGIQARGDLFLRLAKPVSLKFFIVQKGYIPDKRPIGGNEENIMPNYSSAGIGVVLHFYTKRRI